MGEIHAQVWKGSKFTIGLVESGVAGTLIFHFSGPFTARDMYNSLTPDALHNLFESASSDEAKVHIFDLTEVPYVDSTGLGMMVTHFVRCQAKGVRLVLAGAGPRVEQLFKLSHVEHLMPMVATVEEAKRG